MESIQGRSQPDTGANHEEITTGSTTETEKEPGDKTKTIKIKQEVHISGSRQEVLNSMETNSSQAEGNWKQKQKVGGENLELYT